MAKKSHECIFCKRFWQCKERGDSDYCILFKARDEQAERAYKEWRASEGKR